MARFVEARNFHLMLRSKNSGPGIAPEARPIRRELHPPAGMMFYIVTTLGAVKLPGTAHPAVEPGPSTRWRAGRETLGLSD
jgi:hypothetical protein